MAEEVAIAGGPEQAKIRNVIAVAVLPIITLGIYGLVWYYKVNREMADLGRKTGNEELGDSPITSLIAVTIGAIIIVPAVLSLINTFKRIKLTQSVNGVPEGKQLNGWIVLIGWLIFSPVAYAVQQDALNKAWEGTTAAAAAPPAAAPPAPPAPPAV